MTQFRTFCVALLALAFVAPAAEAQTGFGQSVTIAGDEILIGEPGNTVPSGFVYVYRQQDGNWTEVAQLTSSQSSEADGFGRDLAVDGDLLVVGAPGIDRQMVYFFRREAGEWTEIGSVTADDLQQGDGFGGAIALQGDRLVVGAASQDDREGAVYVFTRGNDGWTRSGKLMGMRPEPESEQAEEANDAEAAEDAEEQSEDAEEPEEPRRSAERFGSSVALSDDWILVGAPGAERFAGALYAFRHGDEGWEQVERLVGDENDGFGSSITVAGNEIYVGATGAAQVRIYSVDDEGEWSDAATLTAFDAGPRSSFGASVQVVGNEVFVGDPGADDREGRIYRFTRNDDGNFTSATKMGVPGLGRAATGATLAVSGDTLVAGVPRADYGAGAAVIMQRSFDGWDRQVVESAVRGLDPITGSTVACEDGKIGRFPCKGVDLYSFLPVNMMGGGRGVRTNDIWGWTDPETDKEYALVGMTDQTAFVDVTDPFHPVWVGSLPKTEGSPGSVWRDIKVYADHAFVVSDSAAEHGVQIFDLTRLREFDGEAITFDADVRYDEIASAHNIVINEESAFAYVVGASGGGETCGGGLHMINIEDPKNPIFAGCFADTRTGRRGTGYSHDAQCILYEGPDERYADREICFGSNETALSVADVTDKRNPVAVGMATYPNVAYSHQSWVSEDHAYLYMNDEGDEASGLVEGTRTLIWDIQDLEDPILVGEYIHDVPSVDHNLYVVGDMLYESNYDSGLRILDITDRENPELVGYLDSVPWGEDGQGMGGGSWSNYPFFRGGHVVFTSGNEGIFIVKRSDDND